MWEVIGNIASVCSIIALPIAIWQIVDLKSKVENTEKGIRKVLDVKEHEKFGNLFKIIVEQYHKVSDLIPQVIKNGKTYQEKKCIEINRSIGLCIVELSPQHADILNSLNFAIKHIERFIESTEESNSELKEARDYLNNAIQSMKKINKEFESKVVTMASQGNEK